MKVVCTAHEPFSHKNQAITEDVLHTYVLCCTSIYFHLCLQQCKPAIHLDGAFWWLQPSCILCLSLWLPQWSLLLCLRCSGLLFLA